MTKLNKKQIEDFFTAIVDARNYDPKYVEDQINLGLNLGINPFETYSFEGRPSTSAFATALYYNNLHLVKLFLKYSKDTKIRSGLELKPLGSNKNLLQNYLRLCSKEIRKELISHSKYENINILKALSEPIFVELKKKKITIETNFLFSTAFGVSGNSLINNLSIDRKFHSRAEVKTISDEFEKWWYNDDDKYSLPTANINLSWEGNIELLEFLIKEKLIDIDLSQEVHGLTFVNALKCISAIDSQESVSDIIESFQDIIAFQIRLHSSLSLPNGVPGGESPKGSQAVTTSSESESESESKSAEGKVFDQVLRIRLLNAQGKQPRDFNLRFDFKLLITLVNETLAKRRSSLDRVEQRITKQEKYAENIADVMDQKAKEVLSEIVESNTELSKDEKSELQPCVERFYNVVRDHISSEVDKMRKEKNAYFTKCFVQNGYDIEANLNQIARSAFFSALDIGAHSALAAATAGTSLALTPAASISYMADKMIPNSAAKMKSDRVFDLTVTGVHGVQKTAIQIASSITANMIPVISAVYNSEDLDKIAKTCASKAVASFSKLSNIKNNESAVKFIISKSKLTVQDIEKNKQRKCFKF